MPVNLLEQADEFVRLPLRTFADALPYNAIFPYERQASLEYLIQYLSAKQGNAKGTAHNIQGAIIQEMEKVQTRLMAGEMENAWPDLAALMEILYPTFLEENAMGYAAIPFDTQFIYLTPGMEGFQHKERYSIQLQKTPVAGWASSAVIQAGGLILNTFYGQQFDFSISDVFAIKDTQTGLVQYKRLQPTNQYYKIKALKDLPAIDNSILKLLLENFEDSSLWLHHLPPDCFRFEGIVFGQMDEVTVSEVNARLRERLLNKNLQEEQGEGLIRFIQTELRNFLNIASLKFGVAHLSRKFDQDYLIGNSILGKSATVVELAEQSKTYRSIVKNLHPCIIENLELLPHRTEVEERWLKQGIRSLILTPLLDEKKQLIGIIELASPIANQLNAFTLLRMKGLFSLLDSGFNRFKRQWEEQVNVVIQEKFTAIHKSVRWKFEQLATDYLKAGGRGSMENIVFRNLIPLYGQADIVGSTALRNQATQRDLLAHLALLKGILNFCSKQENLFLIDNYLAQVESIRESLEQEFTTVIESTATTFIKEEVHPFLEQLSNQYPFTITAEVKAYFDELDAESGMVYHQRRKYENSLNRLNLELSKYMEAEEKAMQATLPHYFSMQKTDGIDYNIFLGQSILKEGKFSDYHRKNFELWQLQSLIGVTRMVEELQGQLEMPLQTAQLLFAYGASINIQFKIEEKQFDVEGGINVGYEILKKRIDKATIEGRDERLRKAGTVSVIYLQAKDKKKYQGFMSYLARKGYLDTPIEHFDLAPMQGVKGLKALRAKVRML